MSQPCITTPHIVFSHTQIENLQRQIRVFKDLTARYNASSIPKLDSSTNTNTQPHLIGNQPVVVQSYQNNLNSNKPMSNLKPGTLPTNVSNQNQSVNINPTITQPSLSWQCFNSLLVTGPSRSVEGLIGLAASVSYISN